MNSVDPLTSACKDHRDKTRFSVYRPPLPFLNCVLSFLPTLLLSRAQRGLKASSVESESHKTVNRQFRLETVGL